jgi:SSS family solute:Na+ symporter
VFALGILTRAATGTSAIVGLIVGIAINAYCWLYLPQVSWLWWNVFGFFSTFICGIFVGRLLQPAHLTSALEMGVQIEDVKRYLHKEANINWYRNSLWLLLFFVAMLLFLYFIDR